MFGLQLGACRLCSTVLRSDTRNFSSTARRWYRAVGGIGYSRRWYRAAVLREYNKPLVIEDREPTNKLKDDQVRIRVHSAAVNFSDTLISRNEYKAVDAAITTLPLVPGCELCGEVTECGTKVKSVRKGDRVIALNKEETGAFAEETIAHHHDVWRVDVGVKFEIGAGLLDSYASALLGLAHRGGIKEGDNVVITAAAGGLGLAAVDVAVNVYKAKVIAVTNSQEKAQLVRDKGAFSALSYRGDNMYSTVMDVTNGAGANLIFDAVGGDVFRDSLKCVSDEGTVIVAGFASQLVPTIATDLLLPKACAVIGVSLSHYRKHRFQQYRQVCSDVIEFYNAGLISPHIAAEFDLDNVNEAYTYIHEKKSSGKVIINMD